MYFMQNYGFLRLLSSFRSTFLNHWPTDDLLSFSHASQDSIISYIVLSVEPKLAK